jgi:hypothetical protein
VSQEGIVEHLARAKFEDMFREGRLPSGNEFELMPDTVGIGLKVSEVDEKVPWKRKARQACITTKSVAGHEFLGMKVKDQVDFMGSMLDSDVQFLSMAWTAQNSGTSVRLKEGGVNCPVCGHPHTEIPFGGIEVLHRAAPIGGPDAVFPFEPADRSILPPTIQSAELYIVDPTWMAARIHVPDNSWTNHEVVRTNRVVSCLRVRARKPDGSIADGPPRMLSRQGEAMQMRMKLIEEISEAMDRVVPHLNRSFDFPCPQCGTEASIPFDQGL